MTKKPKNPVHIPLVPDTTTKKPKTPGVIARIALATSPDEVAALLAHAMGLRRITDAKLRALNRAALRRNLELARP
jgi:hypothetical protein